MFLKNAEGGYEPAFFIIRIESDEPPEQLAEANEPTFIHEYLHLLQDLVMPYCMRENMVVLHSFLLQIQDAREKGELRLPNDYSHEELVLAKRIGEVTWGCSEIHQDFARIERIDLQIEPVEGKEYKLHKYLLFGGDVKGYHFGARDLLEYIASKIEARHFPNGAKPPDLPYRSVDLVLAHEGLSHLSDVMRIALAEHCLINDNPAHSLMIVIGDIKDGKFEGADCGSDDAFIQRLSELEWLPHGVRFRTKADKLEKRYRQLRETLHTQFPQNSFPTIHAWLNEALKYAQEALAGRSLFTVLYDMSFIEFRSAMSSLISRLGIPLLVNGRGQLGTTLGGLSSKDEFVQLLLAYNFSNYLKSDETICPLYSNCERDNPGLIDNDDCMDAPFRRASEEELCPFGVFVKSTGLSAVSWYKNGRLIPGWRSDPF